MGSAVVQARNWRLATFGTLGLLVLCVVGLVILGSQPKAVPHIVVVDRLGEAKYGGAVGSAKLSAAQLEASVKFQVTEFVRNTRALPADQGVLRQQWFSAYSMVTPAGKNLLDTFVETYPPFTRAAQERVQVVNLQISRVTENTFQVDWQEKKLDPKGTLLATVPWRGMFRTVMSDARSEESLKRNPLGLFVDEFHWDRMSN